MPKQSNKSNKSKVQTGGKKRKDRALVVRVGPGRPRLHPHPRPRPRPRPRTTVVCNIM